MKGFGEWFLAHLAKCRVPRLSRGAILSFSWGGPVEIVLLGEWKDGGVCLGRRTVWVKCCPARHVGPDVALSLSSSLGERFLRVLCGVGVATSWLARVRVSSTRVPPLGIG
jgi:hypothetical protein